MTDNIIRDLHEAALFVKIETSAQMISRMCESGTPPKMHIPAQSDDEDLFITGTLKDCKTEIKSLRNETKELEAHNKLMISILEKVAAQFNWYGNLHTENNKPEKAKVNFEFHNMCLSAIHPDRETLSKGVNNG